MLRSCGNTSLNLEFGSSTLVMKMVMRHRHSWIFTEPVDPEALGIPDYYDVVCNPMDLGTVKRKLEAKPCTYLDVYEWASDVRLVFANAVEYNGPMHEVGRMASELSGIFEDAFGYALRSCSLTQQSFFFSENCSRKRGATWSEMLSKGDSRLTTEKTGIGATSSRHRC